jgi:DHA2 family metal-tetracycline-proton antiporter-like MFS transporter
LGIDTGESQESGTPVAQQAETAAEQRQNQSVMLVIAFWALPNAILVSLINISLPEIQRDFDVSPSTLTWAASGYIIAGAIGAVVYGKLIDTVGLRRIALICLVGLGVTSIAVSLAPNFALLVAFRVPEGVMGMALPAVALGGILRAIPTHMSSRAVGWIMASFGLGLILGSVFGGLIIDATNWRVPFALVGLISFLGVPLTIRVLPASEASIGELRFDFVGGALITVAVGSTLLTANQLPRSSGTTIGSIAGVVAIISWTAFLRQIRHSDNPFIDPGILKSRAFLRSSALGGMAQAQFVGAGFLLPLVLRNLYNYSVVEVGLLMSIGFVIVFIAGVTATRIAARIGAGLTLQIAVIVGAGGSLAATLAGVDKVVLLPIIYAVLGASYSTIQPVLLRSVGGLLPPQYIGAGMGFYNFVYFAGGAFAVALAGGVIERRSSSNDSLTGLHSGAGIGYVDAALTLLAFGIIAIVLLKWVARDVDAVSGASPR